MTIIINSRKPEPIQIATQQLRNNFRGKMRRLFVWAMGVRLDGDEQTGVVWFRFDETNFYGHLSISPRRVMYGASVSLIFIEEVTFPMENGRSSSVATVTSNLMNMLLDQIESVDFCCQIAMKNLR